jgi:hypothetical protein
LRTAIEPKQPGADRRQDDTGTQRHRDRGSQFWRDSTLRWRLRRAARRCHNGQRAYGQDEDKPSTVMTARSLMMFLPPAAQDSAAATGNFEWNIRMRRVADSAEPMSHVGCPALHSTRT